MMSCFYLFKRKSKRGGNSAPELGTASTGDNNSSNRAVKSTGSLPSPTARGIPEMYREREGSLRVFSLMELREATNNFNRLLKIGEGGFGSVYKGSIKPADGGLGHPTIVAIKKLNTQGLQGHKQWIAEVQFLGVLDHPNLVKLLGYCAVDGERGIQRLLVYEYMQNKSLEDHLFNRTVPTIPWIRRLSIILGAAQGMEYLHEGLEVQVIYRDFKSSNVLLDKDFNPRLSDFGLAREGPTGNQTHVSTAPVGTRGYAAPEYVETGHLSVKSDIWSFGVVLYEILAGRRTLDRNLPSTEQKLLGWVKQFPADSKRFSMIMDPRLQNQYSLPAARRIAKLADSCLNKNPKDRPSMSQVVEILKQALEESQRSSSDPRDSHSSLATPSAPNKPFRRTEYASTSRQVPQMAKAQV
ncbi:probable serine/threonine-protein kinase PBL19 isoform X2 [Salvia miltiorrhiza]|uniref:probable serine/threonine-protein kinase PBL19 isoform X2 n=1 Tax=Salvia miltiorrhiza TaxID=226208 RepID=UPI0025AD4EC9|nr:probable serine/threonine-protein kinase PBL19 isoform X2 [Salvia miltiorrhiza]XP_057773532.1 probable serine/threonine-protein kinase PBL19 isoform X2 [Salvia miltiorrhiza]